MSALTLPEGDWIRGISIKQPWTAAILTGAKTIENRPQSWSWRGWVLLHAGQQTDKPALRLPLVARTIRGRELVTGAVVGIARITGCHQDPDGAALLTVGAPGGLAPGARRRPGTAPARSRTRTARPLEADRRPAGPGVPAAARLPPVTRTRNKKPAVEPGLIPAPGNLLDWRDASHFDCWQDRPCTLCDHPDALPRGRAGPQELRREVARGQPCRGPSRAVCLRRPGGTPPRRRPRLTRTAHTTRFPAPFF